MMSYQQSPKSVVMIRPHHFKVNPETAGDNSFQSITSSMSSEEIEKKAYEEVSVAAQTLERNGVIVHLFEDKTRLTPDSVFPNNWFSTHEEKVIALYPMYCKNRRAERREDIINFIANKYNVENIVDYSPLEEQSMYLEGTGSMVLDHVNKIAYAVKSHRMDEIVLARFCEKFGYKNVAFDAYDKKGISVYHTNVFMCVTTHFVLISLEMIKDHIEQKMVINTIENSGKTIINLSEKQIEHFAGNALELNSTEGNVLAMSKTAVDVLSQSQLTAIEKYMKIIPIEVPTIEQAGGSVRCMLAGIHF